MKTKLKLHIEAIEILNKPGRFVIASQYTENGAIITDNNGGNGYSQDEVDKEISKRLQKFKVCPNCRVDSMRIMEDKLAEQWRFGENE